MVISRDYITRRCGRFVLFIILMNCSILSYKVSAYSNIQLDNSWMLQILELFHDELDEETIEEIILDLSIIAENPFNIRTIQREQLNRLYFLDNLDIQQILEWRDHHLIQIMEYDRKNTFDENNDPITLSSQLSKQTDIKSAFLSAGILDEFTLSLFLNFISWDAGLDETLESMRGYRAFEILQRNLPGITGNKGSIESRISTQFPKARGYLSEIPHYLGSQVRYQERITIENESYSAHFSRSKQYGETMKYPGISGFTTGHFQYRGANLTTIAGDYSISHSHGLLFARGGMRTSTRNLTRFGGTGTTISPYRSASPGSFLRGIVSEYRVSEYEGLKVLGFYSKRYLSATGRELWSESEGVGEADVEFGGEGLSRGMEKVYFLPGFWISRRTNNEEDRYRNLGMETVGGIINSSHSFHDLRMSLSIAGVRHRFDHFIERRSRLHNTYDFSGRSLYQVSVSVSTVYDKWHYSGEVSRSWSDLSENLPVSNYALVHGITGSGRVVSGGVWQRRYGEGYHTIYGNGMGTFGGTSNEYGIGAWVNMSVVWGLRVRLYADRYGSFGARSGSDVGAMGWERGVAVDWRRGRMMQARAEGFYRGDEVSVVVRDDVGRDRRELQDRERGTVRGSVRVEPGLGWMWQSRLEVQSWGVGARSGFGIGFVQGVRYRVGVVGSVLPFIRELDVYAQHTLFSTDSHNSRIFTYEYDMLRSIRIPSFSGEGSRSYIMLHANIVGKTVIRIKYGRTHYFDRYEVGTGHDATKGATRNDLHFQVVLQI